MILRTVRDVSMLMILCISAMDHARNLKFSTYVHLTSIKVPISLRLKDSLQCRRGYYF